MKSFRWLVLRAFLILIADVAGRQPPGEGTFRIRRDIAEWEQEMKDYAEREGL